MRRLAAAVVAAAGLVTFRPAAADAQRPSAPGRPVAERPASAPAAQLEQLMAPWEQQATGISRLSAAERQALEAWLGRYTAALRAGQANGRIGSVESGTAGLAPGTLGAPGARDTIRPAPGSRPAPESRPAPAPPTRITIGLDPLPPTLAITAVYEDGDIIETQDGSLWETYLPDRALTSSWQAGQVVVVRSNPLPRQLYGPAFDRMLVNGEARTTAAARYAGRQRVDPSGATGPAGGAAGGR
jgi:hypothetical protein